MTGANGPVVIFEKLHWRIQQFSRLDSDEIPIFLFEKLKPGMRQRFQRCPEAVLHFAGAIGDAA
jgi:hypothetical protein